MLDSYKLKTLMQLLILRYFGPITDYKRCNIWLTNQTLSCHHQSDVSPLIAGYQTNISKIELQKYFQFVKINITKIEVGATYSVKKNHSPKYKFVFIIFYNRYIYISFILIIYTYNLDF